MKKILALALTLVMLVSLLPVLGVSAKDVAFDMSDPTFNIESLDDTKVKFVVDGNTATLNGSMIPKQTNHAALNYTGVFTATTNVDEFVTQTIKIDTMPVFDDPFYQYLHYASGYFNVLSRNYGTATVESLPAGKSKADCHDMLMYSIYRKDAEGNLGLQIYNMTIGNYTIIPVPDFSEKIGEEFTLTTVWHADNKVTFLCDDESVGTFDNVTFAHARSIDRKQYLSIGYNAAGTATSGANPVKLTVSNVRIWGHTPAGDDGDCTTALLCVDCGAEIIAAMPAHTPGEDDGDCTTPVACINPGCTKNVIDGKPHTPAEDDGDCTTAVKCTVCGGNAVEANPNHKPALRNPKYPTDTEAGYTGDVVCYQCPYVFSEGEEIPMLEKSSFGTNAQTNQNSAIYVYIAIGAAVLVAAAVVIILVVRKKQNRKEMKDSV